MVYCSTPIENLETLGETFVALVRHLENSYRFEATAPQSVEVTMFHQPDRKRYTVSLVNFQEKLPNIPIDGIEVRLRVPRKVNGITQLPGGNAIPSLMRGGQTVFRAPRLKTLAMFAVNVV